MSDNVWPVAAGDGRSSSPPGTVPAKARRQRRPSGAPPPLPHPVNVTTTAWLIVAALVVAGAFAASHLTPWLRIDDQASTWVLNQLAGLRTPWLTDVAQGIKAAGTIRFSTWRSVRTAAILSVPAAKRRRSPSVRLAVAPLMAAALSRASGR